MRTTLNLDDDVFEILKDYAESRSVALGKAASDLMRKGLSTRTPTRLVNGFVVFDIEPGGPKITSERVRELESELE
jgi:hypothetical protein